MSTVTTAIDQFALAQFRGYDDNRLITLRKMFRLEKYKAALSKDYKTANGNLIFQTLVEQVQTERLQ
jgi:hypothetical protein